MFKIPHLMRAAAVGVFALAGTSASAALIDLGFSLDGSGSISTANFNTTRDALSGALSIIPTSGANEYRIAVTTFSTGVATIVPPTIVTAANIAALQATVSGATKPGGVTNTALAITNLSDLFANSASGYGATTLLNITTDGVPSSQAAAVLAADNALAAGVDGISFEAVGSGVTSASALTNMAAIAGPGTGVIVDDLTMIPNPTTTGFVIKVSTFEGYSAAIRAKIGRIVDDTGGNPNVVPLPADLPLLLGGLGMLGAIRARRTRVAT